MLGQRRGDPEAYDWVEASRQILAHEVARCNVKIEQTQALSAELSKLSPAAAKAFYYRLLEQGFK